MQCYSVLLCGVIPIHCAKFNFGALETSFIPRVKIFSLKLTCNGFKYICCKKNMLTVVPFTQEFLKLQKNFWMGSFFN